MEELSEGIAFKEKGKPWLPKYPDIYFNISHSNNFVACGFAESEIGVDIEETRRGKFLESKIDPKVLEALDRKEKDRLLTAIWTRLESRVKRKGQSFIEIYNGTLTTEEDKCITVSVTDDLFVSVCLKEDFTLILLDER